MSNLPTVESAVTEAMAQPPTGPRPTSIPIIDKQSAQVVKMLMDSVNVRKEQLAQLAIQYATEHATLQAAMTKLASETPGMAPVQGETWNLDTQKMAFVRVS